MRQQNINHFTAWMFNFYKILVLWVQVQVNTEPYYQTGSVGFDEVCRDMSKLRAHDVLYNMVHKSV